MLVELDEAWQDLADVCPIVWVVGLDHKEAAGREATMDVGEEARGDEAKMSLARVVIRLRVVEVNFGDGLSRDVLGHQRLGIFHAEPDVVEASLVGAPRRVTDNNREQIRCEMVMVGPGERTQQRVSAVAATEFQDDRRRSAEEAAPFERPRLREPFKSRASPLRLGEDSTGDRDPKLGLDQAWLRLWSCGHERFAYRWAQVYWL
jgi:hypothetical protein